MNKFVLILLTTVFACTSPPAEEELASVEEISTDPAVLLDIDKEFSSRSKKNGLADAFTFYADNDAVMLEQGSLPIVGKNNITKSFTSMDDAQIQMTWEPIKAEMAASGDMGYTYGKYFLTTKDSVELTSIGYYVSIWKKQKDGDWKFVLDGGAEGPVE